MSRESQPDAQSSRAEAEDALGRELARWARADAEGAVDLTALRASFDAELAQEQGLGAALRARSTPLRVTMLVLVLLAFALATLLFRARVDLALYPVARMVLSLAVMAGGFLGSVGLALWPLWRPAPPPALKRLVLALGPLSLAALYLLPPAHVDHPASLQQPGSAALWERALPCLGSGLLVALASMLLVRAFDRGGSASSLLIASASGVAANLLLQLHCPVTAPAHMLIGHLGAALLVLAGVALAVRARSVRD